MSSNSKSSLVKLKRTCFSNTLIKESFSAQSCTGTLGSGAVQDARSAMSIMYLFMLLYYP